jgi:hypothetical protein
MTDDRARHPRDIADILRDAHTVAVLGAHPERARPAFYVPQYLHERGYRVIPVNPHFAGTTLWDEPVRARLAEVDAPVDVVDVFRRGALLGEHVADLLAMTPRPPVVWLQPGAHNDAVADTLEAAGMQVVSDRCMLADHERLGVPARR